MNFVIVTPGYYPHKGAESYCATRFASALANAGHSVHIVTAERPTEMYENSYDALLHPAVKVSRVRGAHRHHRFPYISWRWLSVFDDDSFSIPGYIAEVKSILAQYENPVLISRTYTWSALTVAWHCRRFAAKWIAHFSDPMLDGDQNTKLGRLSHFFKKMWMRRAMRHADAISVTCKRVKWYYREQLGPCVDKAKFILATHIGDFKLEGKSSSCKFESEKKVRGGVAIEQPVLRGIGEGANNSSPGQSNNLNNLSHVALAKEDRTIRTILHDGDIYASRGLQILDAVKNLNEQGFAVEFVQGRAVNNEGDRKRILSTPHCFILNKDSPDELRAQAKAAQVSFVADFNTDGLSYSPFLMSKFVYQLFTDKPIVVLSKLESEKHDYCVAYPEAGLFFADLKEPGSLEKAIKAALTADPKTFDRTRIRERFSEEHIAAEFVEQLECEDRGLLEEKWMGRV